MERRGEIFLDIKLEREVSRLQTNVHVAHGVWELGLPRFVWWTVNNQFHLSSPPTAVLQVTTRVYGRWQMGQDAYYIAPTYLELPLQT